MATTVEKIYKLDIQGADSVNELKNAIGELNDKLKTLNATSQEYKETLAQLTEYQSKLADAMKGISDSSQTTNESLNGIKETVDGVANAFTEGLAQGMAEAAAETLQMGDSMENGVNSVKDLKQHISDLRDKLVTLENGSDEYKATVQELIEAQVKLKEVMNAGKNEMQAADGSYNALTQRMAALKQVWRETTDEATRNEIGQQIAEINAQLKGMDASIGNFQRNVGNYKSALDGLDGSFVNWKQELKECKEAMQQLDPSTQAYADAMARAAEITHQLSEQQEQIKYASTDVGDQLENVRGIATNMAAGFSAVNAAMGLFGEENEEVQQAMLKVQQAMALVQGLQGLDGFIKRTKGLSQAMGLATKSTKAQTTALKADAAASKQDATAKGAEATATAGVIPAQLGLNAAMKANPIGFIIGLIASLIAIFSLLKDKIMEMIGSNKEMSAAFDKVKAVLTGVGNVIKKSVINPIKMAIIPIKTLAKVMIDLFKGDWSKIGDDIKEGFTEMKDNVVDTINVVGAFKEGYDKKTAEQNEAARKAEAAAREKELDNIIKDNEAKYGSDWKYTEEAKKLYDELFKVRMAQYSQDADEYREAQRDKLAYDREFQEKQDEVSKKAADDEKKRQEQAAKEAKQRRDKMLSDFKSAFSKFIPETIANSMNMTDLFKKWEKGLNLFKEELKKTYGFSKEVIDGIVNEMANKFLKSVYNDYAKALLTNLEKDIYNIDRTLSSKLAELNSKYEYEKLALGIEFPADELRHFNDIFEMTMTELRKELKLTETDIDDVIVDLLQSGDALSGILGKDTFDKLQGKLQQLTKMYADYYDAFNSGNKKLAKQLYDELKESDITKEIEEAFGLNLTEFQKLLDKRNTLTSKMTKTTMDNFRAVMDVRLKEYELAEKKENTYYENRLKSAEWLYNQEEALISKRQQMYMGDNQIEALKRQEEYENNYFNTTMEMYQKLRDRYVAMSMDTHLAAEERANAEREAAKITGQIIEEEMNHQTQLLKIQRDNIKAWQNAIKDSVSSVADILSTIGDAWGSIIDIEKAEIAQQLENGEISEEEANRREQLNKESFESLKKVQIAQAIINTLAAAVSAYQSMASIPYVGPVLGAAAAAAALVAGYAQVRQIQATSYESGSASVGGGGGGSTSFQLPDVLEMEPTMGRNLTNQSDIDELNNDGSGRGDMRVILVESDVTEAQRKSQKRRVETTF